MQKFSRNGGNSLGLMVLLFMLILLSSACQPTQPIQQAQPALLCTPSWYQQVDKIISSGDGQGHGPDVGSDEWMSVVEFKLGIRGKQGIPARGSEKWCAYIDELLSQ
ncbi:hypothetical protein E2K93_04220 [Thalassotalea sp. HSM 43]|uniref:hypothetical protein n=1 Tax=Thalassotalea sp. HSM 43 TaxID=2552945 RepID=UPI001081E0B9|nr:hypothetical protein [Thalassotalea sp. HSM 43]QBY03633.1 hypothetical protein E2K93_04220 [Thalassotalea sp. HSM 43]